MELLVEVKNVYGNERVYPACDKSKVLAHMTGASTLTDKVISDAKKLGFTFKIVSKKGNTL